MTLLALLMGGIISGGLIVYGNQPLDSALVEQVSTDYIEHTGFSSEDQRQLIVDKAYELGGLDFVVMIECENGNWNPKAVSKTHDYGICQLNYKYNKKFINSDEFNDVYKQLEYCYNKRNVNPKLWNGPTRKVKGKLCKDYVLDRFIITNERA